MEQAEGSRQPAERTDRVHLPPELCLLRWSPEPDLVARERG
jgi:hypothetical protein